jgi:hypothetical protein
MTPMLILLLIAMAVWACAFDAAAQVSSAMDKGPFDPGLIVTYGWVVLISLLGGFVSFYRRVKAGQARWVNLSEFIGELFTSALAGLLTFWLCRSTGVSDWWMAALVGISGHMGSRAIFLAEKWLESYVQRWVGADACQVHSSSGDRK